LTLRTGVACTTGDQSLSWFRHNRRPPKETPAWNLPGGRGTVVTSPISALSSVRSGVSVSHLWDTSDPWNPWWICLRHHRRRLDGINDSCWQISTTADDGCRVAICITKRSLKIYLIPIMSV